MNAWTRWRIAIPLVGLTGLSLAAAIAGTITWWSLDSPGDRRLLIAISVILTAGVVISLSIGISRTAEIPWLRIAAAALTLVAACGASAFL